MPLDDYEETGQPEDPGGYANVSFAVDRLTRRPVAIKRPRTNSAAPRDSLMRFVHEVKALVSLSGRCPSGFVQVVEANTDPAQGDLYLVMERCAGDLALRLGEAHDPTWSALSVAAVCDALATMHNCRTSHRDLKPANILIREDKTLCIADFGACLSFENVDRLSSEEMGFPGTLEYQAPETIRPNKLPEATFYPADVYAVGVVLYELLAGRPPFVRQEHAEAALGLERAIGVNLPPLLRTYRPDVPGELEDIVHQCLEKEPFLRPTAWDLARSLRQFVKRFEAKKPSQRTFCPRYAGREIVRFRDHIELPIAILQGGDGTTVYRSNPDGTDAEITSESTSGKFRLPPDINDATKDYIAHRIAAAWGQQRFENKLQVRIDGFAREKESDRDGQLKPLKLYTSLTDYYDTHRTHFSIDTRLADGRSIRTKYAGDYKSFECSCLANPICVNLSVITSDNYIVLVERSQLTAGNPGGYAPAVSGTADYSRDNKGTLGTYDPWAHAIREAKEEMFGEFYPPSPHQVLFFGLAKRTDNFCPFLFGEIQTDLTRDELAREKPLQPDEVERLIFIDFSCHELGVEAIRQLWKMEHFSPTAIYSLYVSLIYHFRGEKKRIDSAIHAFPRRSNQQLQERFVEEAVRRLDNG